MNNQNNNGFVFDAQNAAVKQLKKNWNWFLILGIGLVLLGTFAVIFALTSTLISVMYLGIALIIAGFFEAAKALKISQWGYVLLHVLLSILYIIAGGYMIWNPAINALTLTLFLAIFFVVSGTLRIFFALTHEVPHKGWLMINGGLAILLGGLIWYQWPASGLWIIGTLVGIEFIFTGWAWIMLALKAKKLSEHTS